MKSYGQGGSEATAQDVFTVYNGDFWAASLSMKGTNIFNTSINTPGTVEVQSTWDFSAATVIGLKFS